MWARSRLSPLPSPDGTSLRRLLAVLTPPWRQRLAATAACRTAQVRSGCVPATKALAPGPGGVPRGWSLFYGRGTPLPPFNSFGPMPPSDRQPLLVNASNHALNVFFVPATKLLAPADRLPLGNFIVHNALAKQKWFQALVQILYQTSGQDTKKA